MKYRIDRGIDPAPVFMGVPAQGFNILNAVAGFFPGTEAICADINRIRPVIDGSHADGRISGRGQKFYPGLRALTFLFHD
jgi:hypothetical protein